VAANTEQAPLTLVLPLPPSPNQSSKTWQGSRAKKNSYRMECWASAVDQCKPRRWPVEFVEVRSAFFVRNLRDEDNLKASLKFVLDTLKQVQRGNTKWKGNDARGFIVDDNALRCRVLEPTQRIDRKRPRLELTISPIDCAVTQKSEAV
jgi:hypothetical protein